MKFCDLWLVVAAFSVEIRPRTYVALSGTQTCPLRGAGMPDSPVLCCILATWAHTGTLSMPARQGCTEKFLHHPACFGKLPPGLRSATCLVHVNAGSSVFCWVWKTLTGGQWCSVSCLYTTRKRCARDQPCWCYLLCYPRFLWSHSSADILYVSRVSLRVSQMQGCWLEADWRTCKKCAHYEMLVFYFKYLFILFWRESMHTSMSGGGAEAEGESQLWAECRAWRRAWCHDLEITTWLGTKSVIQPTVPPGAPRCWYFK